MNNLTKRILSAIILAPLVLYIIYIGGIAYYAMVGIACVIMLWEWFRITATSPRKWLWWIGGMVYIVPPCFMLASLHATNSEQSNFLIIFLLVIVVWTIDITAYIFGKLIGGPKIAPSISPNKTWAGLIGAIICTSLLLYFCGTILPINLQLYMVGAGVLLPIIAQAGDFFESWIKRKFDVKDSSNIIPGHGGLLDRLDGLLAVVWLIIIATIIAGLL